MGSPLSADRLVIWRAARSRRPIGWFSFGSDIQLIWPARLGFPPNTEIVCIGRFTHDHKKAWGERSSEVQQFEIDISTFRNGVALGISEVESRDGAVTIPTGQRSQWPILWLVFGIDRLKPLKTNDHGAVMRFHKVKHSQLLEFVVLESAGMGVRPSVLRRSSVRLSLRGRRLDLLLEL